MKVGTVALIGRPNTGKSTLVNNLVGQKVSITSPKPQTTQFPIYAVYEDERGQIIFVDTPGIFAKTKETRQKEINEQAKRIFRDEINAIIYLIDHTRQRGLEENRVLGIVRTLDIPKILVINKVDIREPSYREQYKFLEDEFLTIVEVSALKNNNLGTLLDEIFEVLPEGVRAVETESLSIPSLNINSNLYIEEMIREKAFLRLRREVPYKLKVIVDEIKERPNDILFVKARILTFPRYKKMIIGAHGSKIKEIGMMSRRELELAGRRKVFLDLQVEARDSLDRLE